MSVDLHHMGSGKLHYLKRRVNNENASLRTHLLSIVHDSGFVLELKEFLDGLVLFANLYVRLSTFLFSFRIRLFSQISKLRSQP